MERLIHPISGEQGYFTTVREKELIDIVMCMLLVSQIDATFCSAECGANE